MRLYLAPIRGITDYIFRDSLSQFFGGFDCAVAPFVSSVKGRKIKPAFFRDLLPENNRRLPTIPQILSKDCDDFIYTAQQLFDLGYGEINWNLGCPAPMVANKQRGSGLLPYPEKIEQFLEKVTTLFPGLISVKTRLGRQSPDEIMKLIPLFNQFSLKNIIIHPRLGVQMYKGVPDIDAFEACFALSKHRVVYNGDIVDLNTYQALQKRFPKIEDWMVGRGVLWNPYLALGLQNKDYTVSRERLLDFHDDLMMRYAERLAGPGHLLGRMKGIWCYFARIFARERIVLKRISKTQTIEGYKDVVKLNFDQEELVFLVYTA